jgi:hypothetical protein
MKKTKSKKIFSPLELEKAKKELLYERLNLLPVEVRSDGYYYDPHELFHALKNNPPLNFDERKNK